MNLKYVKFLTIVAIIIFGLQSLVVAASPADQAAMSKLIFHDQRTNLNALNVHTEAYETIPITPLPLHEPDRSEAENVVLTIGSTTVRRGESTLPEPPIPAQIINGCTMLPFRYLVETVLGGEVSYDSELRKITAAIKGVTISLFIDAPFIEMESIMFMLDQAPKIKDDYTLVPLQAFSDFTQQITWDEAKQTVTIMPWAAEVIELSRLKDFNLRHDYVTVHKLPDVSGAITDKYSVPFVKTQN